MTKIIFKARTGSHLFGTSTPTSDVDIKGVYIPSADDILKPTIPEHISLSTGNDKTKNTSDDVDEEYYALHKFLGMLGKGDMVATEMLFAKDEGFLKIFSDDRYLIWDDLFANRHRILSRECKGFVGYVQRQANTYSVKGDRLNEINEAIAFINTFKSTLFITRFSDFFEWRTEVEQFCKGKKHTSWELVEVNGKEIFHFICCDRKVPETVKVSDGIAIFQKVADEYGNRARAAAQAHGHDWKALSHAVRVGEEAIELLSTGNLIFPRPNAAHLLDIKLGNVPYSEVSEKLDRLLDGVEKASKSSILPEKSDFEYMEKFTREIYALEIIRKYGVN